MFTIRIFKQSLTDKIEEQLVHGALSWKRCLNKGCGYAVVSHANSSNEIQKKKNNIHSTNLYLQ